MTPVHYPTQAGRGPAPTALIVAVSLTWLLVALLVLRAVLTYALFDSLVDSWVESRGSTAVPREIIEDGAPAYRQIALGSAVVFGGVLALAAAFLGRGAGWARIVVTVFAVLALLGGLSAVAQPAMLFTVTGIAVAVVALMAVVMLWLPGSSAAFRARRAAA